MPVVGVKLLNQEVTLRRQKKRAHLYCCRYVVVPARIPNYYGGP